MADGDEFDYRSTGPAALVSLSLERAALEAHLRVLLGRSLGELRLQGRLSGLRTDPAALHRLCLGLASRAAARPALLRNSLLRQRVERRLLKLLFHGFAKPREAEAGSRNRTLARRAEAWLRQNLTDPPTIAELCAALHASERTVHEAFRAHLGATPKAYLKTLRLNAARHDLALGLLNTRVTDVALDWGFLHFGWFSRDYKRLFAETPRQTLQRGRADGERDERRRRAPGRSDRRVARGARARRARHLVGARGLSPGPMPRTSGPAGAGSRHDDAGDKGTMQRQRTVRSSWIWFALLLAGCGKKEAAAPPPPDVKVATVLQRDVPIYVEAIGQTRGPPRSRSARASRASSRPWTSRRARSSRRASSSTRSTRGPSRPPSRRRRARSRRGRGAARPRAPGRGALRAARREERDLARRTTRRRSRTRRRRRRPSTAAKAAVEQRGARPQLHEGRRARRRPDRQDRGLSRHARRPRAEHAAHAHLADRSDPRALHDPGAGLPLLRARERQAAARRGEDGATLPFELILADGSVHPAQGTLVFVDRNVDAKTGTILLEAAFPNPGGIVRPGQYARVRAAVDTKKGAILVPQRAVQELQGIYNVAVVGGDDTVEVRPVKPARAHRHAVGDRLRPEARRAGRRRGPAEGAPGREGEARDRARSRSVGERRLRRGAAAEAQRRVGELAMANFFIRRPIVAIVISILIVLLGPQHAARAPRSSSIRSSPRRRSASPPTTRARPRSRSSSRWRRPSSRR